MSRFERSTGKHQHPAEAHSLAVVVVEALLAVQFRSPPPPPLLSQVYYRHSFFPSFSPPTL